jgi:chemotaxis protein CheD
MDATIARRVIRSRALNIISVLWERAMVQKQIKSNAVARMTAVNFSEMKISRNPAETLVAFSIGAGMAVAAFDPGCGVGGILNFMLPDSTLATGVDPVKVPLMFADTGVPFFVQALLAQGIRPNRVKLIAAGGAHVIDQTGLFNIGQKNYAALKSNLANYDLSIHHEDIGGTSSRTLSLEIGTGSSCIKAFGRPEVKV